MSSEELHAPRERLSATTVASHQAIVSLMEELEAMDWYRQRADDSPPKPFNTFKPGLKIVGNLLLEDSRVLFNRQGKRVGHVLYGVDDGGDVSLDFSGSLLSTLGCLFF